MIEPWRLEAVDAERMREFAVLLADPNPIHLDAEAARARGLGDRVVNQGPANFGYVLEMLRVAFPGAEMRSLKLRLLRPVFAGDVVVAGGTLERVDGRIAHCRVWLDVEGAGRALDGTASLSLTGA